MKYFIIILLALTSFRTHADQAKLLSVGRDHHIDLAIKRLKTYCGIEVAKRSVDSTYICRRQVEADCAHGSDAQKKLGCSELKILKSLEKKIKGYDATLAQLKPSPLYSSKPEIIKVVGIPANPVLEVKVPEVSIPVKVWFGSSGSLNPDTAESRDAYQELISMRDKINTRKVRIDCQADSDCAAVNFGKSMCGGPAGFFAYNTQSADQAMLSEIKEFSQADDEFQKKWNRDMAGTCAYRGSDSAKCIDNKCI